MENSMIINLINKGGAVMWPLLVLSLLSFLIITDRIVVLIYIKFSKKQYSLKPLKFVRLLELIGQIAPALGFLGTVFGIMESFKGISLSSLVSIQDVSQGMYQALYTTAAGLVISIVNFTAVQIFRWSTNEN